MPKSPPPSPVPSPIPEAALSVNVNDLHAPEFFASFLAGCAFDGPNVRLSLASNRYDHAANVLNHVVNVRLVMSIASAQNMVTFLTNFLNSAELNAVEKSPDAPLQ